MSMVTAIFGLVGVVVGAFLTSFKEWWFNRQKNRKERDYLAVLVSCALDAYVRQCADVVGDNGLYHGQTDQDGCLRIQTDTPKFEPENLSVEWKSLPTTLMYEIWGLPNQAKSAQSIVDSTFEHCCSPDDSTAGFQERRFQYAKLGLTAAGLAEQLRELAGLEAPAMQRWDPIQYMKDELAKIVATREEQERLYSAQLRTLMVEQV